MGRDGTGDPDSQQLLQGPLLEGLVGAVHDVGLKVVDRVVLHDVADVPDQRVVVVTPLQVLKKPAETEWNRRAKCESESERERHLEWKKDIFRRQNPTGGEVEGDVFQTLYKHLIHSKCI